MIVVPNSYASFFDAASQAAGALIGLLFVVIALKPGKIVGDRAEPTSRSLGASSFIGLVNAFFVSLLALIPGHHNIGIGAAIVAAFSLFRTLRLHLGRPDIPGTRHILALLRGDRMFRCGISRPWQLMESTTVSTEDLPTA